MNELHRLASRLPVKRISRWEMFIAKLKMRVQDFRDLNFPVAYRYYRKFKEWIEVEL